ncbi:MAG: hypothetical protein M1348_02825 [Candidatus Parvarchaeota archaeon]|nr:hypothetical protein [Candidatus Parvarchaeota archaeon]
MLKTQNIIKIANVRMNIGSAIETIEELEVYIPPSQAINDTATKNASVLLGVNEIPDILNRLINKYLRHIKCVKVFNSVLLSH